MSALYEAAKRRPLSRTERDVMEAQRQSAARARGEPVAADNDDGLEDEDEPSISPRPWPKAEAFGGILGEIVGAIAPHTEADRAALLIQLYAAVGAVIGRQRWHDLEAIPQHGNVWPLIVGRTSSARKGTSWGWIRRVLAIVDPLFAQTKIMGGFGSGEALVVEVRDGDESAGIPGVADKRLLIVETEFTAVLRVVERQGSILAQRMRQAWDDGNLYARTRGERLTATNAHIGCIAHCTPDELRRRISYEQIQGGTLNRFLLVYSERDHLVPDSDVNPHEIIAPLAGELRQIVQAVRSISRPLPWTTEGKTFWRATYTTLASSGLSGALEAITARATSQIVRLCVINAAVDGADKIDVGHIRTALAIWDYCHRSAAFIFGDKLREPEAQRILDALRDSREGYLYKAEITRSLFKNRAPAGGLGAVLRSLEAEHLITLAREQTDGRTRTRVSLCVGDRKKGKEGTQADDSSLISRNSPALTHARNGNGYGPHTEYDDL
jgi:hypothetical protein